MEKEKGILVLLQALRLLGDAAAGLRLQVAGNVTDEDYFRFCRTFCEEAGLGGQVDFLGHLHAVETFLRGLDLFVLPSTATEAFPRAVLEAMACGLPVVATALGGVPEAVAEGRTGFVVPPGDPGALAERLRRLIASEDLRRRMGDLGRRRAEALFGWERNTAITMQIYEALRKAR